MSRRLTELKREIFFGKHTKKEWLLLDQEVNKAMEYAEEDEVQAFLDSGAGEMLDMICSSLRNMGEMR